jgi:hypothetical protein
MSKVSSDAARFNRIKARRNVHRAKMRVLRAEMAARKLEPGSAVENPKTLAGPSGGPSVDA